MTLKTLFHAESAASQLLTDEEQLRVNADFLRHHCRGILEERGLRLAVIAYDYFIIINEGNLRKDDITPSEQHEQLHIILADALLKSENNRLGWDRKKFGGEDAFFTALIFHDVIEDRDHKDLKLLRILEDGIEENFKKQKRTAALVEQHSHDYSEASHAVQAVRILSRNWPDGDENKISRIEYMNRLFKNPLAVLAKQIDWANKEATMVGVVHFEKDGQSKLRKNIEETDEFFGDERQAMPRWAAHEFPKIKRKIEKLDAVMAILHHSLKGYASKSRSDYREEYEGSPRLQRPYDFSRWIPLAKSVLRHVPAGANLVKIQMDRIYQAGEKNPVIHDYYKYVLGPAVAPLLSPPSPWSLHPLFNKAASCVGKKLETLWAGPQRML